MFVILGFIVVLGSVFGGYALAGGYLGALWQPLELLMIGGAAVGAFLAGNSSKVIKATVAALPGVLKGPKYPKETYMELMSLLYELLSKTRKDGFLSIEGDIEKPLASPIFKKYPRIVNDHHLITFITDYLRIMISGNLDPMEIENLMDVEIETHHHEEGGPARTMYKLSDGMPAFGIVAAVMGVVHTMESIGAPPAELGIMVAHALVGTFLGILLSYGFVTPLAAMLEQRAEESTKIFQTVKVTLLASLNGYAPVMAIEFGRKVLYSTERPGFKELEEHVKKSAKGGK